MVNVEKFIPIQFGSNCYVVYDDISKEAAIIDPSVSYGDIEYFVRQKSLKVKFIIATHSHFDHIQCVNEMKENFKVPVYVHSLDYDGFSDSKMNVSSYFIRPMTFGQPDYKLEDNQVLKIGNEEILVMLTPGHTKGSITLKISNCLFTGDLLFKGGMGRTDLPGGDSSEINNSLKKVASLDGDFTVYPGHGEETTLKEEKNKNIYIREAICNGL